MALRDSSSSKHRKGQDVCPRDEDGISRLPDAILCHILSLLPTKYVIRSSVLSKRWSYLCTSIPNIELDDLNSSKHPRSIRSFMNIVDRVLCHNEGSCLRKFRLSCEQSYDLSRISNWINAAIMLDLEEIDLAFWRQDCDPDSIGTKPLEFPFGLFISKKLVVLKLRDWRLFILNVPSWADLTSLKILHLHRIHLFDEDSIKNLIGGCPVLEELDIETADDKKMTVFIQSSSLKTLRLHTEYGCRNNIRLRIVVDAKNIEILDLKHDVALQYDIISSFSSLVKVKLHLCGNCMRRVRRSGGHGNRLVELLRTVSSTEYLFLGSEIMKWLEYVHMDELPVFHNVKHLELKTSNYSWQVLPDLLECFPNLRTFGYHKERVGMRRTEFQMEECSIQCLEDITLTGFRGSDGEMEMVRYFLNSATVLKKMLIKSSYSSPRMNSEILENLLTIPIQNYSTVCQITFNGNILFAKVDA